MKSLKIIGGLVLIGLLVTGCSNPVYVQKDETADLSGAKTYMWVDTRSGENDQSPRAIASVYTQPFTRVYYNPYRRRWTTLYYPSQFMGYQVYQTPVKQGTITITLADARTDRNIWQAWTTERLDRARPTADEIEKGVRVIFKKFDTGKA